MMKLMKMIDIQGNSMMGIKSLYWLGVHCKRVVGPSYYFDDRLAVCSGRTLMGSGSSKLVNQNRILL